MPLFRACLACAVTVGILFMIAPGAASAAVPPGGDGCDAFATLQADAQSFGNAGTFDGNAFAQLSKAFKKARKNAPKELKSSLKQLAKAYTVIGKADSQAEAERALVGKSLQKFQTAYGELGEYVATNCAASGSSGSAGGSSGRGGMLTLGAETIALDSARCYLQEQTAAGQKIELTAQASGTNAAGDQVIVDFSRYAAGGRFAGDDISIDIGTPGSSDSMSYGARLDIGAVNRSGSTFSADDIEVSRDDGSTTTASFEMRC